MPSSGASGPQQIPRIHGSEHQPVSRGVRFLGHGFTKESVVKETNLGEY
jgi:hypothetical protein